MLLFYGCYEGQKWELGSYIVGVTNKMNKYLLLNECNELNNNITFTKVLTKKLKFKVKAHNFLIFKKIHSFIKKHICQKFLLVGT